MPIITTADEAVKVIKSGAVITINGFGGICYPDELSKALEQRFLETGSPSNLVLWHAAGQGGRNTRIFTSRLGYEGLLKRVVAGHWDTAPEIVKLAAEEKIEAYNFPQGVISHLLRAAAGSKPAIITEIGLKTFMDPRIEGGKLNKSAQEDLITLRVIDGKEYLEYKAPKIDVCFIRGTTADPMGNITMEKEAVFLDILSMAQAAKANGGTVICQVERLSDVRAHAKNVKVPGCLVDYIVLASEQKQTRVEAFNPAYSGDLILPGLQVKQLNQKLTEMSAGITSDRNLEDWVIARRAALEMKPNSIINLGIGIPAMIGSVADQEEVANLLTITVESGTLGGVPAAGASFGATINPDIIYDQSYQFDFYDGGNLDVTFVGAMQIDATGNVNVSKIGSRIIGVGGFINITQTAKKVVYCTTFTGGKGFETAFEDGKMIIKGEGKFPKFVKNTTQISYSGEYAASRGQEVFYVTERCVFKLTSDGMMLIEIAPGLELQKDILDRMEFTPLISKDLKMMDPILFTQDSLGLKAAWIK